MKKIILSSVFWMMIGNAVAFAEGQRPYSGKDNKEHIEKLVGVIEKSKNNPLQQNNALQEFLDLALFCSNHDVPIPQDVKSDVTRRLAKVFAEIENSGVNSANKLRIIEGIGNFDNGPEAHKFILKVLEFGSEAQRKQALYSIYFGRLHGADIYDKIKNLVERDVIPAENALSALKGASPERAKKDILKVLATTKDLTQFVQKGLLLCEYDDPDLIDVLVDRYEEFREINAKSSGVTKPSPAPSVAIHRDLLRKYIEIREGKRLSVALLVLKDKGISSDNDLPLWKKKLKSRDAETRGLIVDFLNHQINAEVVSPEKVKELLRGHVEGNKQINKKIQKILAEHSQKQ